MTNYNTTKFIIDRIIFSMLDGNIFDELIASGTLYYENNNDDKLHIQLWKLIDYIELSKYKYDAEDFKPKKRFSSLKDFFILEGEKYWNDYWNEKINKNV